MLTTATKLRIARLTSRLLLTARRLCGLPSNTQVMRHGVHWMLDLDEGIDLAIYLGVYEPDTLRALAQRVRPGQVVFDIGANIGAITLPLARLVGAHGRVHAFEPTAFAYAKLGRNLAANEQLAARVSVHQIMLVEVRQRIDEAGLYASWPLVERDALHPLHCGELMTLDGAVADSVDDFMTEHEIAQVDVVKLDVDGNELRVLRGARQLLQRCRPLLIFELAPYILDEQPGRLEAILEVLHTARYQLVEMNSGRALPIDAAGLRTWIPYGCGLNIIGEAL